MLKDIGNGHYVACHNLDMAKKLVVADGQDQKTA
jgi:hypothetical protein